jgi:hypothetical protein
MQADIWTGKLCYERGRFETDSVLVNRHHNDERPVLDQVVLSLVWTCRILHATLSAISFFQYRFALGDLPETFPFLLHYKQTGSYCSLRYS